MLFCQSSYPGARLYCKLCSVWVLNERLNCKSMEIKWYKYMKVDRVGERVKG